MPIVDNRPGSGSGGGGGVTSVNGDSGPAVVITKSTVGLSNVDNTSDANKPVSTAQQTALNAKSDRYLPSNAQVLYVNYLVGNDGTGDGCFDKPFKTINAAMATISDATQNKPYVIALMGARQIETADILVKPYVSIVGMGQRASYIRAPGFNIKPHGDHSTGSSWVLFKNFYLGGGTGIDWDLQAIGGSNCVLVLENLTIGGILRYKGRNAGGGDYLEAYTNIIFGAITLDSVFAQLQTGEMVTSIDFTNTQGNTGLTSSVLNVTADGGITSTNHGLNLYQVAYPGSVGITTTGTVAIESYRGLPPVARRTLSGGTTVNESSDSGTAVETEYQVNCLDNATEQIVIGSATTTERYEIDYVVELNVSGVKRTGKIELAYDANGVIFDDEEVYSSNPISGLDITGNFSGGNLRLAVALTAVGENSKIKYKQKTISQIT